MPKHIIIADNQLEICLKIKEEVRKVFPEADYFLFENGEGVLQKLEEHPSDIIIMDIVMPKMNGLEATFVIKKKFPGTKIILTSATQINSLTYLNMIVMGAVGFVGKNCKHHTYWEAIESVVAGTPYFDEEIKKEFEKEFEKLMQPKELKSTPSIKFTRTELKILTLICDGLTTSQIAKELFVEPTTIETHRKHIYERIGTNNIAEVIKYAIHYGYYDLSVADNVLKLKR